MSNSYFRFKQFTIHQEQCAMKVGTDGTLLGAWAQGGERILDIGTGTGLIALMMAQRFPQSQVVGIDIDGLACEQALENVAASPFHDQVQVTHLSLQNYTDELFDSIVCNPPFFVHSLLSPDKQRTTARHAGSLTYVDLFQGVVRLLHEDGVFSAVIPLECRDAFDAEAILHGMCPVAECAVKTSLRKQPKRFLLSYRKKPSAHYVRDVLTIGSEAYVDLMKDFYLSY